MDVAGEQRFAFPARTSNYASGRETRARNINKIIRVKYLSIFV